MTTRAVNPPTTMSVIPVAKVSAVAAPVMQIAPIAKPSAATAFPTNVPLTPNPLGYTPSPAPAFNPFAPTSAYAPISKQSSLPQITQQSFRPSLSMPNIAPDKSGSGGTAQQGSSPASNTSPLPYSSGQQQQQPYYGPDAGSSSSQGPQSAGSGGGGYNAPLDPSIQGSSADYPVPSPFNVDNEPHIIQQTTANGMVHVVTPAGVVNSAPAVVAQAPKPGLIERFLMWLGFGKSNAHLPIPGPVTNPVVQAHGEMSLEHEISSMVRRARAGDQVAISIIACMRENAMNGDPTAQRAFDMMCDYCDANPF